MLNERPAKALSLVRHLPHESAFRRAETGGIPWGWQEEATIAMLDLLQVQIRVALGAAGVKASKIPKVVEIERPFEPPKPKPKPMPVKEMVHHVGSLFASAGRS